MDGIERMLVLFQYVRLDGWVMWTELSWVIENGVTYRKILLPSQQTVLFAVNIFHLHLEKG